MTSVSGDEDLVRFRVFSFLEAAEYYAEVGQFAFAQEAYSRAVVLDSGSLARLRYGEFFYQQGEFERAALEFQTALELGRGQRDFDCCAAASWNLSLALHALGESALAAAYRQQAIAATLRNQAEASAESAPPLDFSDLANDAILRGDLAQAEEFARQALRFPQKPNCHREIADAWGTWAVVQLLASNYQSAWRGFLKAYQSHCRARDGIGQATDLLNLAQTAREAGWWKTAKKLLLKAGKVAQISGTFRLLPQIERALAETTRVLAVGERTPEWN